MTHRLRPWHPDDDAYLIAHQDAPNEELAAKLKRTVNAVKIRRHVLINRKELPRPKPHELQWPTQDEIRERAAAIKAKNLERMRDKNWTPIEEDEEE